jgi:hypothetical protein
MRKVTRTFLKTFAAGVSVVALSLAVGLGAPSGAQADEADAKKLLKSMSDYMASQNAISFGFDATLEVITKDKQKLALASSGALILNRPGKIRATRSGGHADVEMLFDGKTLTLFGNKANLYTQISVPGTIDNLVDVLREKYKRPLPAADLITSNSFDPLMADVTDVKDLGSGVINGVECDYLAFRKKKVDIQIWIAQGAHPYPCRYVITSNDIPLSPQYSIQLRDWKTGNYVASDDFGFKNASNATKVDVKDLKGMSPLPGHFKKSAADADTKKAANMGMMKKDSVESEGTIRAAMNDKGHIALYGITFDLDKAVMNAESNTTIREIAKFLKHHTDMKIAVIGHTDATGTYKHNMKLSKDRADAVVAMLTKKLGVKKNQVFAAGVGWLAPLATSNTDEGRALNRRVELIRVKKGGQ